jgi:hypothetical protein
LTYGEVITFDANYAPDLGAYSMTVGRAIIKSVGTLLNYKDETLERDGAIIPMKPENANVEKHFHKADSIQIDDATKHIECILDTKHEPADLQYTVSDSNNLSLNEQQNLHVILCKHNTLFDGSLGT